MKVRGGGLTIDVNYNLVGGYIISFDDVINLVDIKEFIKNSILWH
jgi:hypothetical protein